MEQVLVVFEATATETESLALAFGLGAVEGGAKIRLRHLDSAAAAALEHQGYTTPKDADIDWAQGIGLALESAALSAEVLAFLEQVKGVCASAPSFEKSVYVFGGAAQRDAVLAAKNRLAELGFSLVEDKEDPRAVGKYVAAGL